MVMRTATLAGAAVALMVAGVPTQMEAQSIQESDREAMHAEPFGLIGGARELSDGRVVVADPMGKIFVMLDANLGSATALGSEGQGPDEYRQPDGIWPIGGDNSVLVDLGNARLTQIDANGGFGETVPIVRQGAGGMMFALPRGSDDHGNVYFQGSPMGPRGMRDEVEVFRLNLATEETEVVARIKPASMDRRESGGADNQQVRILPIPLAATDVWGVRPDGGLYVARADDYTVEFIGTDGRVVAGPANDYDRVRIGGDEREEWSDRQAREGGVGISVEEENGRRRINLARSAGGGGSNDLSWPDNKPPFENERIRVDHEGRGWVRVSMSAGAPATYDVFNEQGNKVATVTLPEGRSLVGFGSGSLYAAAVDEFDQHYLERFANPLSD